MDNITFSQAKLNGPARQSVIEAVQNQLQQAALAAILPLISQFLAAELSAKLGRAKGEPRSISTQPRLIDWDCVGCGCNDANYFIRDGHYQRTLATTWGYLKVLPVPMIECAKCQHDVVAHWAILEKYARFWLDFDQKALFGSGVPRWVARSVLTINERINQVEAKIRQAQVQPLEAVPAVVQLDGIWLSLQTQSEIIKLDRKGRKRHLRSGKRAVILVALGLWSDGSGRREILDWELAEGESEKAWTKLLERLVAWGLTVEAGLKALIRDVGGGLGEAIALVYGKTVVDQRCIFHTIRTQCI